MTYKRTVVAALLLVAAVGSSHGDEPRTRLMERLRRAHTGECESCSERRRPLRDWMHERSAERRDENGDKKHRFRWFGLHCFADFDNYGCSSLHSTGAFIFGSCRTFFREKCLATEPVDPIIVYRYNQQLYPNSGDQVVPGSARIPIFGNTEDSKALFPEELPTLKQERKSKRGCRNCQ